MATCMLLDAGMPKRYWGEAVMTAVYLQNRLPSRAVERTPFELWTGRVPDLQHLRVFGCVSYVRIPSAKQKKFENRGKKLIFVGYSDGQKAYRFLDPTTDRITISRDDIPVELGNGSEQQKEERMEQNPPEPEGADSDEVEVPGIPVADEPEEPNDESVYEDANSSDESDFYGFDNDEVVRRSSRVTRGMLPQRFDDYVVGLASHQEEPRDYKSAMDIQVWRDAMQEEMDAHEKNGTWKLVQLPAKKKLIGAKWVFKIKRDETGAVVKNKARIVAQGYTQKWGLDYSEVFAPVARQAVLRGLLAIAGKRRMVIKQYDCKTAYLNGTVQEELYMRQPPGFEVPGHEDKVCKLERSIYGLRQSARCWNKALHTALLELGFVQCESDSCLYKCSKGTAEVYLLVYVDDLLLASTDELEIKRIFMGLRSKFEVKCLGNIKHFLGHDVQKEDGYYTVRLASYIDEIVHRYGMQDAHPVKTPMDPGYTSVNVDSSKFTDTTLYRSLVGALLYLAVNARPDVALSVGLLGRKIGDPNKSD